MKKEQLKKIRTLYATREMMAKAGMDVPVTKQRKYIGTVKSYKYGVYVRCQIHQGILKAAFFLADLMRLGLNKPVYEVFINKETGEFVTWDVRAEKWRNAKLDMLEWPEYTWYSGRYINPEGNKSIKRYLGTSKGGYAGILEYQQKVRADKLKEKYRKETEPWDMMMDMVPELPKDWEHWWDKQGMDQQYIFYEYTRKGAREGYCTRCEKMVPVNHPKHNTKGKCQRCGREVQFKARGKAGSFYTDQETVYLIQRCEYGFVIRQFKARRHYYKGKYENPDKCCFEEERFFYDKDLHGQTFYYGLYKQDTDRWIKNDRATDYHYVINGRIYKRTIPTLETSDLARTGLPQMIRAMDKIDPECYIKSLRKYPILEQLAKAGLCKLAYESMLTNELRWMNRNGDLAKKLQIDKARMKRMRENNGGSLYLRWLRYEKNMDTVIDDKVLIYFEQQGIYPKDIEFIRNRMGETKICNYLKKQSAICGIKPRELLQTWKDYLCMANRNKMNTQLELIYKPKDLKKAHDDAVKLSGGGDIARRAGEIAEKFPNVDEICQSIKEKYAFTGRKYAIVVPEKIEDIILEGRVLGHCIDRSDIYFERIQNRESFIVFLRKVEALDTPYYTMEIEPCGTARQKRTTGDRQNKDFEEAKSFIQKWQQEIQKRMTEEDRMLAETSAVLREKEFQELRDTKAKIWHGHLAGQLLVDVLQADLMEVYGG